MQAFYESVLPTGSVLVASRLGEQNQPHHYLVSGRQNLEEFLAHFVADGYSVHMALGGFAEAPADGLQAEYCKSPSELTPTQCKSIALDLDVGDTADKFDSIEQLEAALIQAITDRKLPTPTWAVRSGGGMHVYYAFTRNVPVEEWFLLQSRLRMHARNAGLLADVGGTTRPHVLQRSPQSWNFKFNPPLKCNVTQMGSEIEPEDMEEFLPHYAVGDWQDVSTSAEYGVQRLNSEFFLPACAQMQRIKEHGAISRGDWIALANAAYYMTDGTEFFHAASEKYPGYDKDESQHTLEEIALNASAGPWPCNKFTSGHESLCVGCKAAEFGAKNPVAAARMVHKQWQVQQQQQQAPEASPEVAATQSHDEVMASLANVEVKSPAAVRFFGDSGALYYQPASTGEGDTPPRVKVCEPYVEVTARVRNEASGDAGLMVRVPHEGGTVDFRASNTCLVSSFDLRAEFVAFDVVIDNDKLMTAYLTARHHELRKSGDPVLTEASTFGWKNDGRFVLYDRVLDCGSGTFDTPLMDPSLAAIGARYGGHQGEVAVWVQAVRVYDTPELLSLLIPTLLSIGAPLLSALDIANPGVYSLWGATGSGKTTANEFASSVWGKPIPQHVTAATSSVATLRHLSRFKHLPMAVDEVTTMTGKQLQEMVFTITQGTEKERLTSQAESIAPGSWVSTVCCTTNASVAEALSEERSGAYAEISRVLEVKHHHFDPTLKPVFTTAVNALQAHHGVFGPRALCQFVAHSQHYSEQYRAFEAAIEQGIIQTTGTDRQSLRYRVRLCALCCLSHVLAKDIDANFPHTTADVLRWSIDNIQASTKATDETVKTGDITADDFVSAMHGRTYTVDEINSGHLPPNVTINDILIIYNDGLYFKREALSVVGLIRNSQLRTLRAWNEQDQLECNTGRMTRRCSFTLAGVGGKDMTRMAMYCLKPETLSTKIFTGPTGVVDAGMEVASGSQEASP